MGCGQSKINLYPRKNKNGGKGHSAKKSGAVDKDADEEEGTAGAAPADDTEDEEHNKHTLPLAAHPPAIEVSASQQDFFKMLDDKIEKGKDYDSSSETEVRLEHERRRVLIDQWRSASQSSQSFQSQPSPPTPARRRVPRPPERQSSPNTARRCYRQAHVPDGMSPPPRRAHSAQSHHADPRQINGDNWQDPSKSQSPVKRPQSAGASWKNNPKVAPYNQKPKKNEVNEQQRANQKDDGSSQEVSQITFNPTFQSHSPAHSAKSQQPYIAQIISYPMSQQVTPPSPPKYIAPPEEYQDPQNNVVDNKFNNTQRQTPVTQGNSQSHIYYIHGNATSSVTHTDLAQQRQQTAIHLQQYVAMKQAQQQMFSYMQRGPHTVFPNVEYVQAPNPNRMYEGEEFVSQYPHPAMRPHSAPTPVGVVRPMPVAPGFNIPDGSHMVQMPMWPHMTPVVSTMGPWVPGQMPPEMQYYPQSQFMPMYRPNSAGSAGTLTRYHKKDSDGEGKNNLCQSINLVRQKPIGQIVSLPGQELTVCNNASDSPSPASVSTDSGVSPGNSVPSSKNSGFSTPSSGSDTYALDNKNKKNKTVPFNTRSLKNSKSLDS
ncbi:uncharacterized protein tow [Plodia interpunctella]|uniref:uncharacterized protein tow n=1 Tax=Plodia interpunctella TaxID=58824 RepID=UPI0023687A1A|nr:uncharacterized protein LOC128670166 [Plodia interpunctella]